MPKKSIYHPDITRLLKEFSNLPQFPDGRINYTNSKRALVLTCFPVYQNKFLILKRSEKVTTNKNKWHGVAGYIDQSLPIEELIFLELKEEVGIEKDTILSLTFGQLFEIKEEDKVWLVIPSKAALKFKSKIKLNWEHTNYAWINADEINNFETVTGMDEDLRRVGLLR